MMQQEDGLLVSHVAGKLVNVIATINQTPTSPLTSLRYVLAATIPSKPWILLLILPCLLLSYTSIEVMNTKRRQ